MCKPNVTVCWLWRPEQTRLMVISLIFPKSSCLDQNLIRNNIEPLEISSNMTTFQGPFGNNVVQYSGYIDPPSTFYISFPLCGFSWFLALPPSKIVWFQNGLLSAYQHQSNGQHLDLTVSRFGLIPHYGPLPRSIISVFF